LIISEVKGRRLEELSILFEDLSLFRKLRVAAAPIHAVVNMAKEWYDVSTAGYAF
jgi:hypothetical protein